LTLFDIIKEEKEAEAKEKDSPSKSKKSKKSFSPPDHLFKYRLEEVDPDEGEGNVVSLLPSIDRAIVTGYDVFYFFKGSHD
jgi:hypothetical protein